MVPHDLLQTLHAYSLKNRSDTVNVRQFASSAKLGASGAELETALREFARKGKCILVPQEGEVRSVVFTDYFLFALADEYKSLTMEPSKLFPKLDTFYASVPASEVVSIDIKTDFASFLEGKGGTDMAVAKLSFPEEIDHLIVPRSVAGTDLIEAAVAKLSAYLSDPKNSGYIESKLVTIFKGNDILVRKMIEEAASRPKKASSGLLSPSDFAFRFWTYLVNLVLQDFRKKKDKTVQDQGICQSAYVVGYYAFYRKGQAQKEQERTADKKTLEQLIRKPPYVFTFEALYALTDEKGVPFVAKHTHEFIHSFLGDKTRRAADEGLPFLVRVHVSALNKDYYIQKDLIVPVFLKKLTEAAEELHDVYLHDWVANLRAHVSAAVMKNDASFRKDVEVRVKEGFNLLSALANAPVLFLAKTETNISPEALEEIQRCFRHDNTLRPLHELMGLYRSMLLSEAKSYLPLWETMPILRHIVAILRRLFVARRREAAEAAIPAVFRVPPSAAALAAAEEPRLRAGKKADERAAAASEREALARYRRSIQLLRDRYVPMGKNLDKALDELAEKWNPLFAEQPKKDLVEDVNALVRDFLRPIKRTMLSAAPDINRIRALADQLCGSKSLAKIKKKELLKRYIELYMIKCLEPPRKEYS